MESASEASYGQAKDHFCSLVVAVGNAQLYWPIVPPGGGSWMISAA